MDLNRSAMPASSPEVVSGQSRTDEFYTRLVEAQTNSIARVDDLAAQVTALHQRVAVLQSLPPNAVDEQSENVADLSIFLQRNAGRVLNKIIAECRPAREQVSFRNSIRQLVRKSEKANCSFFTLRCLVDDLLKRNVPVKIYPAADFIVGTVPASVKTVQIIFNSFKEMCDYVRVPQDLREKTIVQCAFDQDRRASAVHILGSLMDIVCEQGSQPTRSIAVGTSLSAPVNQDVIVLHQCPAVWSENSWDAGFILGGSWEGHGDVRSVVNGQQTFARGIRNYSDNRAFCVEWRRDREARAQVGSDLGKSITGEVRVKIPVVSIRCPVVAQSVVDIFREGADGEFLAGRIL